MIDRSRSLWNEQLLTIMLRHLLLPSFLLALLVSGCKKETTYPPAAVPADPAVLSVSHVVDGLPLTYDTLLYTNEAGALYSVTKVEYYLSELVLMGTGSTANDTLHGPWYVNAAGVTDFDLSSLRAGTYSGATMLLGLPPALNITGALPNTIENINMAWPEPMGGGYHFIKFEGRFVPTEQHRAMPCTSVRTPSCPTPSCNKALPSPAAAENCSSPLTSTKYSARRTRMTSLRATIPWATWT